MSWRCAVCDRHEKTIENLSRALEDLHNAVDIEMGDSDLDEPDDLTEAMAFAHAVLKKL